MRLKARATRYRVLFCVRAVLVHHESYTRGKESRRPTQVVATLSEYCRRDRVLVCLITPNARFTPTSTMIPVPGHVLSRFGDETFDLAGFDSIYDHFPDPFTSTRKVADYLIWAGKFSEILGSSNHSMCRLTIAQNLRRTVWK